jgi:hypothetical protein
VQHEWFSFAVADDISILVSLVGWESVRSYDLIAETIQAFTAFCRRTFNCSLGSEDSVEMMVRRRCCVCGQKI